MIALWVALLVLGIGFFIRAAVYFGTEKRQKDEIITVLKEIRDALKRTSSGWCVHKAERTSNGIVVPGPAAPPPHAGRWRRGGGTRSCLSGECHYSITS